MGSNSINIGWNKYETAILIDAYIQVKEGKLLRKDAVAQVSKRLRERMLRIGTTISETYRNENGISMQMSAIGYAMGNDSNGISHVSNIFREIVKMYNEENDKFHQLLSIANAMYPKVLDVAHTVKPTQKVEPYFPKLQEELKVSMVANAPARYTNNKIKHILETRFANGYRLGSHIETKKLLRYYLEEYGYELNMDMEDIEEDVKSCGIVHEKRVYLPSLMLEEDVKQELIKNIESSFNDGKDCIYYSVLFEDFHDSFLDNQIYDEKMLKEYLYYIGGNKWYFKPTYFSNKHNAEENILADVIGYVKEQGVVVSEDEVVEGLSHLPEQSVRRAFNERRTDLINCGRQTRFHIDNFVLSNEELSIVEEIIEKAINLSMYISFGELLEDMRSQVPSIIENNVIFTDIGIRKVIAIKLEDKFSFVNNLISSKENPISTEDAYRALAKREYFTNDDVNKLGYDCDSLPNVYIDLLLQYSIRINENEYVTKSKVSFDVNKTDEVLSRIITKDYIAINDIETLSVLPDCGYPWTSFLLESYVFNHSELFRLFHAKYFNQTVSLGGIVKKASPISDFDTMVAHAVIDDYITLNKDEIINFMYDKGYIAKHRYKDAPKIIDKVRIIKKTK